MIGSYKRMHPITNARENCLTLSLTLSIQPLDIKAQLQMGADFRPWMGWIWGGQMVCFNWKPFPQNLADL